jgi:hypothetical protein
MRVAWAPNQVWCEDAFLQAQVVTTYDNPIRRHSVLVKPVPRHEIQNAA